MVDMLREEKQKQHPQLYTAVEKDMDAAAGTQRKEVVKCKSTTRSTQTVGSS